MKKLNKMHITCNLNNQIQAQAYVCTFWNTCTETCVLVMHEKFISFLKVTVKTDLTMINSAD